MIVEIAFVKSEQQIQNQWSLHTEGNGEPPGVQVAALMSSSIHSKGTVPVLFFFGEAVTGLVPSCYCICFFTIHRMFCMCCEHALLSINYALKTIFPFSQGLIRVGIRSWLFVCSSGASSTFLCFCNRAVLLSSCGNTFSVALTFTRSLKFASKYQDMSDHMQKYMGWGCWTLLA